MTSEYEARVPRAAERSSKRPAPCSTVLASVAPSVGSSSRITVMPAQPGLLHGGCWTP